MTVKASTIFNVSTAYEIPSSSVGLVGKEKMFCDSTDTYCYLVYSIRTTNNKIFANKYLKNATTPFGELVSSTTLLEISTSSITPTAMGFDVMDYDNDRFYIVFRNSTNYLKRYWVNKTDLSTILDTDIPLKIVNMNDIALLPTFDLVYANNTGTYRFPYILFYTTGYVNNSLSLTYNRINGINAVYVPETQEYWVFFTNDTIAKAYRYSHIWLFQGSYTINTHPVVDREEYATTPQDTNPSESIYAYYYNHMIYFAIRQNTPNNNTWYVNVINPTETKNLNSLVLLGSGQNLDLSLVDSWVGNSTDFTDNQTTSISFYFDDYPTRNAWYVLYNRQLGDTIFSSAGKEMMYMVSYSSCICSDWINASQCGYDANGFVTPNVRWQTRVCNPTQCDSEGQFADCTETAPTVNYKHITPPCSVCQPKSTNAQAYSQEYLIPAIDGSASCSMSFLIPSNALNITSRAIISLSEENTVLGGIPDNSYTAIICNPLISGNCGNETFSCKTDTNISFYKGYDSYTAGNTATASVGVGNVGLCSATWNGLGYGWTRYWVNGQLCVEYEQVCGGWKCTYVGSQSFEVYEKTDCSFNITSQTNCPYDCDSTTGRCKTSTASAETLTKCTGDPFTCILTMTGSVFSHNILMLFGIMITGGSTVYGTIIAKKWQIGIVVGMVIALFFLAVGWLDSWIVILWILSVAILFMKAVFFKGD